MVCILVLKCVPLKQCFMIYFFWTFICTINSTRKSFGNFSLPMAFHICLCFFFFDISWLTKCLHKWLLQSQGPNIGNRYRKQYSHHLHNNHLKRIRFFQTLSSRYISMTWSTAIPIATSIVIVIITIIISLPLWGSTARRSCGCCCCCRCCSSESRVQTEMNHLSWSHNLIIFR